MGVYTEPTNWNLAAGILYRLERIPGRPVTLILRDEEGKVLGQEIWSHTGSHFERLRYEGEEPTGTRTRFDAATEAAAALAEAIQDARQDDGDTWTIKKLQV